MRVYHFVNEKFGLDDIYKRRLKIATLNELNDPFELFGVSLGDESLRHAFAEMKRQIALTKGMLCFSKNWSNPVQWSHYADNHSGLCLGFDIPDENLMAVNYSRKRLVVNVERFTTASEFTFEEASKFLTTKYSHWRYENEVRAFVTIEERDLETGFYFADFSDELKLSTIIVGAQSSVSRAKLICNLGTLAPTVEIFKARLAFKTFRVVRQRNKSLWD